MLKTYVPISYLKIFHVLHKEALEQEINSCLPLPRQMLVLSGKRVLSRCAFFLVQ